MKLSSTFPVPAKPARVFECFLDAPTMRACIPGCEELARLDERHYSGRLVNQIAHVRFGAAFSVEILERDPPREVRAVLKGEDRRLASSMRLDATLLVEPDGDDASKVAYSMDLALWGKLGRLGESIFRRRTAEVEQEFVERFSAICSPGASVPAPVEQAPGPPPTMRGRGSDVARTGLRAWWRRLMARLKPAGGRK